MRISDWSSDVCSSDLNRGLRVSYPPRRTRESVGRCNRTFQRKKQINHCQLNHLAYACGANPRGKGMIMSTINEVAKGGSEGVPRAIQTVLDALDTLKFGAIQDRTSVVWGKCVSVRVDLGGSRLIKKKKK